MDDMELDAVFKALADPTRRALLDRLRARDGQSLGELQEGLAMTRFGVMKHLGVLEEAGLVVAHRAGRRKLHYLNPVPIRAIHDRWIGRYREPWVRALLDLKSELEEETVSDPAAAPPAHVFRTWIRTTPERLWAAITDPEVTTRYFHGTLVASDWTPGAPMTYRYEDGREVVRGEVIDADPPHRLVVTWSFTAPRFEDDPPSRVTWEIEPQGDVCRLTVTHDAFEARTATFHSVGEGWPAILSSMKSLLETGEPLSIAK